MSSSKILNKTKLNYLVYLGCYTDEFNSRQLTGIDQTNLETCVDASYKSLVTEKHFVRSTTLMTTTFCSNICKLCDFKYVGLNDGWLNFNIDI